MLLTKKYKPKSLEDLVLPKRILDSLKSKSPLLLYGPPGVGKTSSVDIWSGVYQGGNPLRINCSLNTSIENLRGQIVDYCSRGDLFTDIPKAVILDEIEGVSAEYFKALRGVMEEFSHVRWLATTNYINKIPEPVLSRFEVVNFNLNNTDLAEIKISYAKWILDICKLEGVSIEKEAITILINKYFPDFRSTLLKLNSLIDRDIKKITQEHIQDTSIVAYSELFEHILKETSDSKTFTYIHTEFSRNIDECFYSLGREFPKYLEQKGYDSLIGDVAILVHKYSYESRTAIDLVNSLYCCVVSLRRLVQKK